jgi:hypothetical protein
MTDVTSASELPLFKVHTRAQYRQLRKEGGICTRVRMPMFVIMTIPLRPLRIRTPASAVRQKEPRVGHDADGEGLSVSKPIRGSALLGF